MKSKILHFVLINICFISFSCISDKYKETSVVPKKSTYLAASQTIEDIEVDFSNGSNDNFIMTFAMSGSLTDTSVAVVLSSDKNVAKIKHTTNGSRNLLISYYAKGQLVSKDSVIITTSGATGTTYTGNILYLRDYVPYICKSNGTSSKSLNTNLYLNSACFDMNAQNLLYVSGSYLYNFEIDNKTSSYNYVGTTTNIFTNKTGNICVNNNSNTYLKVYNSDFSSFTTNFYPYFTGSTCKDKYLNIYNSSTNYECASISSSSSYYYGYTYNHYVDYTLNGYTTTVASKSSSYSYYNLSNVKISPNSKYVSYIEYDGSYYYLKVYNISSKSTTTVYTNYYYGISGYSFSPDGTKIVLSAYNSSNSSDDLYVVNSTGGTATNITNTSSYDENSPDWK